MAPKNTVLKSINEPDGPRCVDVFERPDGTYGFETYRRDPEDNRGWFPDGSYGDTIFTTEDEALANACSKVSWLNDVVKES